MTAIMKFFCNTSCFASAESAEAAFACANTFNAVAIFAGAVLAASVLFVLLGVVGLLVLSVLILAILGILVVIRSETRPKEQKRRL